MFNIENSYWNNNGKYQEKYVQLEKLTPSEGWTDNTYINLLTAISNIYYRFYNDGDTEISEYNFEKFQEGIEKFGNQLSLLLENITSPQQLIRCVNSEALEDMTNAIIQIGDKIL